MLVTYNCLLGDWFYTVRIIIITITVPTVHTTPSASPRLIFADGAAFPLLVPEPATLLWPAIEGDAAWVGPVDDWYGMELPGSDVGGAVNAAVAVMSSKDDNAAAEFVAMTDKTVVTIYVVKYLISYT